MRKRRGAVSVASFIVVGLMSLALTTSVWAESNKPVDAAARVLAAAALKDTAASPAKASGGWSMALPVFNVSLILVAGALAFYRRHYRKHEADLALLRLKQQKTTETPFKLDKEGYAALTQMRKKARDLEGKQLAELASLNSIKDNLKEKHRNEEKEEEDDESRG